MYANNNQHTAPPPVNSYFKLLLLLCFIAMYGFMRAQPKAPKIPVNKNICSWSNICLNKCYMPTEKDSCLFVVSTRNYDESKHEFLDYDYDTSATLKYFAIYYKGNNWTVTPFSSLEEMLETRDKFRDLVVFTEGLGKTFTLGVDRATRLMRMYDVDEIFFDWPTQRPYMSPGKNIHATYSVAPQVAVTYALFLEEFQNFKNKNLQKFETVTLFFHSMGNLILMHDLKKDLYKNIRPGLVDNVVLNAACVDQYKHKVWLNKLNFAENIYVTINNRDKTLIGACLVFSGFQLGVVARPKHSGKAHYVNFSSVLKKEHNYFLIPSLQDKKPYLKQFYTDVFTGKKPNTDFSNPEINTGVSQYVPKPNAIGISGM